MNSWQNKLIESALKSLTKQIHTIWKQNINKITILLNIKVFETFDTMSHFKLLHNLKKNIAINCDMNENFFTK